MNPDILNRFLSEFLRQKMGKYWSYTMMNYHSVFLRESKRRFFISFYHTHLIDMIGMTYNNLDILYFQRADRSNSVKDSKNCRSSKLVLKFSLKFTF